jgi:hypothetical protein
MVEGPRKVLHRRATGRLVFFDFAYRVRENADTRVGEQSPVSGKDMRMKKSLPITILSVCLSFAAGVALAERVHDWADLESAHNHVEEAIKSMNRARAANHYDMAGHGAKAEEHLHAAERELHESIEAAKAAR